MLGSTDATTNAWRMLTYRRDGSGNCSVWLDNAEEDTATGASDDLTDTYDLVIGDVSIWSGKQMEIGGIAIWKGRELTDSEVGELWNSGNGIAYPFSSDVTVTPSTLTLSLTDEVPTIDVDFVDTLELTLGLETPTLLGVDIPPTGTTEEGTGSVSSRWISKEHQKRDGSDQRLIPTGIKDRTGKKRTSNVPDKEWTGL